MTSLDESLDRLGLGYVDLYLIHAPFEREQRVAQWRGLVEARRQGKARAIGVSNYSSKHIEELRSAGLPMPAANQLELHPWSQKPDLVRYLGDHGITPIACSSLVPLSTWRTVAGQDSAKTEAMKADGEQADSLGRPPRRRGRGATTFAPRRVAQVAFLSHEQGGDDRLALRFERLQVFAEEPAAADR